MIEAMQMPSERLTVNCTIGLGQIFGKPGLSGVFMFKLPTFQPTYLHTLIYYQLAGTRASHQSLADDHGDGILARGELVALTIDQFAPHAFI